MSHSCNCFRFILILYLYAFILYFDFFPNGKMWCSAYEPCVKLCSFLIGRLNLAFVTQVTSARVLRV